MTAAKAHEGEPGDGKLQRSLFPLCEPVLAQSYLPAHHLQDHVSQYKLVLFLIADLLVLREGKD